MKRKSIGIVTFMLVISLFTGCSNKTDNNATTNTNVSQEQSNPTTPTESEQSDSESTQAQTSTNTNYERGTWSDNIYTNKTLGFTFELPDNWTSLSLEQLNAISAAAEGEAIQEEEGVIYDLSVVSNDTGDGIQLVVGDLTSSGEGATALSAEVMAEIYKAQLQADGTEYTYKDPFNIEIAGQEYYVLAANDSTDNTTQWYMIRNNGKYIITFLGIFDTANEEAFKTHMARFKAI